MSKSLQLDLIELGYGDIVGTLDGIVGVKTKDAVKKLQGARRLIVDGIVGKRTRTEIAFLKKNAGKIGTRNFHIDEFRCPDKNSLPDGGMDADLLLKLEILRWSLGNKSVRINSGFRTPGFNARIGGIATSNHLTGKAADIKVIGVNAELVYYVAMDIFEGVGKYQNFTHVDTDSKKVRFIGRY